MLISFFSLSFCIAMADWSLSKLLVGSRACATFSTSKASAELPASIRRAARTERPRISTSLGIRPICPACTTHCACLFESAASRSVRATILAALACAEAHTQSSSAWSCFSSSSSTSKAPAESACGTSSLCGGAAASAAALLAPAAAPPLPSAPSSSSSHSRSYMLSPTAAGPPCSRQRRPCTICASQARMRRQRLSAFSSWRPSSICSSSSARLRSCWMVSMPFHPGVEGPSAGGVTFSTSILMTTGPVVSGTVSKLPCAYAVLRGLSMSLMGTPSRRTTSNCMPSVTLPAGMKRQRPMHGGTNSPCSAAASSPTTKSLGSLVRSSFTTMPSLPLARPIRVSCSV
mmetsp:Transcript_4227/g.8668  ORF Transcript_4227/g.8668 Transcript_4227/m.8668 type:complete len:346 (+) Transcript_4227:3-1040(+)